MPKRYLAIQVTILAAILGIGYALAGSPLTRVLLPHTVEVTVVGGIVALVAAIALVRDFDVRARLRGDAQTEAHERIPGTGPVPAQAYELAVTDYAVGGVVAIVSFLVANAMTHQAWRWI